MILKNLGFITEEKNPEDYILGGVSDVLKTVLMKERQWQDFLPQKEPQKRSIETSSCVSFATLNAIETLMRRKFNLEVNYSDRYLAAASGTNQIGNTPNKVCETLRKYAGCVLEASLPFTDDILTFDEYIAEPRGKHFTEGRKWLNKHEFKHEWVPVYPLSLINGLQYSPIAISVVAWIKEGDYYVRPKETQDNHFTLLVGYEFQKYWLVYDTYPESDGVYFKKLAWNYWENSNSIAKSFTLDLVEKCWIKNLFNL